MSRKKEESTAPDYAAALENHIEQYAHGLKDVVKAMLRTDSEFAASVYRSLSGTNSNDEAGKPQESDE